VNLIHLLLRSARWHPERPALALGKRQVRSYGEMARRVSRLATGLSTKLSLRRGDRVAIAMRNCPEYYEVLFACGPAGLPPGPRTPKLQPREFPYIRGDCAATAGFLSAELAGATPRGSEHHDRPRAHARAPAPARPQDPAWLFYTSGTTGVPKGAMLTHRNLLFQTNAYFADVDKLGPADTILHAAPLSHGSGLYGLPRIAAGAANVIPESGHFDPAEIFELLERWENVSFFAAPTMIVRLLSSPHARTPRNLKTISYGGAPMYVADCLRAIELFGPRLYQLFGQGESPMTITGLPQSEHARRSHLETCGLARTGVEVKVVDAGDNELPPGETGEIVTRSDCVMAGYWGNAEATAKALRGGWLHTGDLGSMDARGFLTIKDRSKDMIISGGSNIYPREIEEVLLRHPGVAECSVIGRQHAEWGEEVVAFVVARHRIAPEELDSLCLDNIARFKRPREYRFVDALPKNNYGKVLKTELRARLQERKQ
jgi:long-chain acyl-CoA synthetase